MVAMASSPSMSIVVSSRLSTHPLHLIPINASLSLSPPLRSPPPLPTEALSTSSPLATHNPNFLSLSSPPRRRSPSLPSPTSSSFSPLYSISSRRHDCNTTRASAGGGGWFSAFVSNKKGKESYPDVVKVGDPVLHEPARDVPVDEIASDATQKIVDNMIQVMRNAPGVGLAAPQIGVPLKIIVLEDTKEYVSYVTAKELEAQDRRPFDLLVIINPKLKTKGNRTALFFEGCLSVDGYRAIVERHLAVEVTGLDRDGRPIKVDATGWQARILQHECDHLDGTIYVDRMLPRTFRAVENLGLPLPAGCPKLGKS